MAENHGFRIQESHVQMMEKNVHYAAVVIIIYSDFTLKMFGLTVGFGREHSLIDG